MELVLLNFNSANNTYSARDNVRVMMRSVTAANTAEIRGRIMSYWMRRLRRLERFHVLGEPTPFLSAEARRLKKLHQHEPGAAEQARAVALADLKELQANGVVPLFSADEAHYKVLHMMCVRRSLSNDCSIGACRIPQR